MRNTTSDRGSARPDQYHITERSQAPQADRAEGGILRPVLWVLLVISGAANVVTSSAAFPVLVGIGFGLLTCAFGAALIVGHYRRRRR